MNSPTEPAPAEPSNHGGESTHLSATRTLLSMLRTGATIAGGGAVVTDLLVKGWPRWVAVSLSSGFLVLGSMVMWAAVKKGRELRKRLAREHPELQFLFPLREVTIGTAVLQVLIATVLLLYILQ